ncbi:MAG: hypothetical protein KDC67_06290 [Ignavibacteriae bacterium]|nr:hypothetical protein [Ignavibacteriota bacterium]
MKNIFKILIPKENAQEVTELESWTLRWEIQGELYNSRIVKHKSFIKKEDAEEYEKQLKYSANLLGTWVDTFITRN